MILVVPDVYHARVKKIPGARSAQILFSNAVLLSTPVTTQGLRGVDRLRQFSHFQHVESILIELGAPGQLACLMTIPQTHSASAPFITPQCITLREGIRLSTPLVLRGAKHRQWPCPAPLSLSTSGCPALRAHDSMYSASTVPQPCSISTPDALAISWYLPDEQ